MKNFFKFLGVISLVLVIGFSMAACKHDGGGDDNSGNNGGQTGGGNTLDWPADIKALGDQRFQPSGVGTAYIKFKGTSTDWEGKAKPGNLEISSERAFFGNSFYATVGNRALSSVEGTTIKIDMGSSGGGVKTLCTSYTITGTGNTTKIIFTGGDTLFATITDVELSVY